jgi:drug/metabolite transporter (DMT)-like permease
MGVENLNQFSLFGSSTGDNPYRAMSLLLFGVIVLALQDSLIKFIAPQTSFWQMQTIRAFGNTGLIIGLAIATRGLKSLVPQNWKPVYLRGTMLSMCMFFFFAGAPFLSVAQMAAGLYTYPLFVSILAGPLLGERLGPWRITALTIGAGGALLMLNPFSAGFSSVQLMPVIAGFFYASNILVLRRNCRTENPLALTFAVAIIFIICGFLGITILSLFPPPGEFVVTMPFVAIGWPKLTISLLCVLLFCSILNLSGNICLARAYQTADSSWLAPLDFSYLLFAAIWGRLLFNHWPTWQALAGMVLIASAGMVTAWRESLRRH